MNKTHEVDRLVREVLSLMEAPFPTDVIGLVGQSIEREPAFKAKYERLATLLSVNVVNQMIGYYTRRALKGKTIKQVAAPKDSKNVLKSYTILSY